MKTKNWGHQGREKIISKLPTKKKISKLAVGFFTTKAKVMRLENSVSQGLREVMQDSRTPHV